MKIIRFKIRKLKNNNKKKELRTALRNLANFYNNYSENRNFILLELEKEGILVINPLISR